MKVVGALAALVFALAAVPAAAVAAPTLQVTLDRRSVGLGDPFHYVVEARAPNEALRVIADTGPFAVVSPPRTSRSRSDGTTVVRIEQTLACLDRGCAPNTGARRVLLPPAQAIDGAATTSAPAAAITLEPRVAAKAVAASRAVYRRQVEVPPASTPLGPGLLAALLAAAAAVVAALAVLLAWRGVRRPDALLLQGRVAGGLERALRLLRESAGRPAPDRRRAADYAGRAAAAHGGAQLADDASRVAWSPPDPEPTDVGALAERIETTLGSER